MMLLDTGIPTESGNRSASRLIFNSLDKKSNRLKFWIDESLFYFKNRADDHMQMYYIVERECNHKKHQRFRPVLAERTFLFEASCLDGEITFNI